jgi:hypothetical protein
MSLHFRSLHITSISIQSPASLTLFLKVYNLQGKDAITPAGKRFQSFMVLFTEEYLPIFVFCFLLLIFLPTQEARFQQLSPIAFQTGLPVFAL